MSGEARTEQFALGTATVMIGPADKLFDLNEQEHSIGLVKNFALTAQPGYTDLTQGVKNNVVYSVLTSNPVKATMEVYEHTAKNLAYSLALDGSAMAPQTATATVAADAAAAADTLTVDAVADFAADDYVTVTNGADVFIRKVKTIDAAAKSVQVDVAFAKAILTGAVVKKVNMVAVGSKKDQPFMAAKIVGQLADGTTVAVLIPKIRVTNGFSLAFDTTKFGNLPYQFSVYDLVNTDTFYDQFKDVGQAMLALDK